jgi:hypothetical protein
MVTIDCNKVAVLVRGWQDGFWQRRFAALCSYYARGYRQGRDYREEMGWSVAIMARPRLGPVDNYKGSVGPEP